MQERKAAATRGREWEYVLVFLCHCKRRRVAESSFDRRGRGGISIPQRRGEVTSSDLTRQQQLAGSGQSRLASTTVAFFRSVRILTAYIS